ncbi:Gmad2 immunoglobulin-like domain-containing protein [Nocardioides sp. SYSU D00038]|uniref:Gmad2 immunoglobulin-like domain-containing protein n=1 Tax=Nocardioides sp. SYSU D00038 TaxID=2812554 RepID=UPI0019678A36|nr:Gmad2 immunoglobulin-like domain-containing protein [Nocardioides sp. SYSU D00038]
MDDPITRLVHDAVAEVEPTDRLAGIRSRVATRARHRLRTAAGGTALVAAAAVAVGSVVAGGPGDDAEDPAAPPARVAVPAYYVGDGVAGAVLFREFVDLPASVPRADRAARVLTGTPGDPDYRTLWPQGSLGAVRVDGGTATIEVTDPALAERPAGMGDREAELALQQVVHTVDGVFSERLAVAFVAGGRPLPTVLGEPAAPAVARADGFDVLSLMSITYPYEGAEVSGSFVAEGVNNGFEASALWSITDASGREVLRGHAQAQGWGKDRVWWPWRSEAIDVSGLPPGGYTFRAENDDPSGGTEGLGPASDTRAIIVEPAP